MASKFSASIALFLILNLLGTNFVTACEHCSPHKPPKLSPPYQPRPTPDPASQKRCPRDAVKLGVCVDLLGGLLNLTLGAPPKEPCCTLLRGLDELEAAVCLCTVVRGSILGIRLSLPININLVLNYCGKKPPAGFRCF